MKKTLILALFFSACSTPKEITLTVKHIERSEGYVEVYTGAWYMWCTHIPDSIKVGKKITVYPFKCSDTCNCVFKRIK